MYLALKLAHLFFVIAWFAALFYLPRLFVYHADTLDEAGHARFVVMERRLYRMGHVGMGGTLAAGVALVLAMPGWLKSGWLHAKLLLVALLIAQFLHMGQVQKAFARGQRPHSARFFRFYNELPGIVLLLVLWLVLFKPF